MKPDIRVKYECEAGHVQSAVFKDLSREWVEAYCRLVDGTSALYAHPPGPGSVIGKCCLCGRPFKASIVEENHG